MTGRDDRHELSRGATVIGRLPSQPHADDSETVSSCVPRRRGASHPACCDHSIPSRCVEEWSEPRLLRGRPHPTGRRWKRLVREASSRSHSSGVNAGPVGTRSVVVVVLLGCLLTWCKKRVLAHSSWPVIELAAAFLPLGSACNRQPTRQHHVLLIRRRTPVSLFVSPPLFPLAQLSL